MSERLSRIEDLYVSAVTDILNATDFPSPILSAFIEYGANTRPASEEADASNVIRVLSEAPTDAVKKAFNPFEPESVPPDFTQRPRPYDATHQFGEVVQLQSADLLAALNEWYSYQAEKGCLLYTSDAADE